MSMLIENSGILTSVQDEGRFGYEQYGVSPSGPMDRRAMHIANVLVGNPIGESCLECTIKGPAIRFTAPAVVAVTGADCAPALDGKPVPMCAALETKAGSLLALGFVKDGCRSYIAVAGGIKVPVLMNSKCTMLGKGFGGLDGRKLAKGDVLETEKEIASLPNMSARRAQSETYAGEREIRVIMGPQDDMFTQKGLDTFLGSVYTVAKEFDRQGYRLEGPLIEHKTDGNIISDGIVNGSIQVPTDGRPIIMLAEHQTVGGYTKIATVITADLPVLGQCKAGDRIRFRAVTVDEAQDVLAKERAQLEALEKRIAAPAPTAPAPRHDGQSAVKHKPPVDMKVTVNGRVYTVRVEKTEE